MQSFQGWVSNIANYISTSLGISSNALISASIQILLILMLFVTGLFLLRSNLSEAKIRDRMKKSRNSSGGISNKNDLWSATTFLNESLDDELIEITRNRIKSMKRAKTDIEF